MDWFDGVKYYKDDRLPCSRSETLNIPKDGDVSREFFVDSNDNVWGYFESHRFMHKVYLSESAFDKIKNAELTK
ncbi:MAG: hypothetical protein GY738_04580 [Pseudoalteromonas sp.]|nr:hypothetical protein [Pseudoalteromonas sp.]